MKKRRRLANKLTIMVCAVLVAVSAFFYVPMEVRAEDNEYVSVVNVSGDEESTAVALSEMKEYDTSIDVTGLQNYFSKTSFSFSDIVLCDGLNPDSLYHVTFTFDVSIESSLDFNYHFIYLFSDNYLFYQKSLISSSADSAFSKTCDFYMTGAELAENRVLYLRFYIGKSTSFSDTLVCNLSYSVDSVFELTNSESDEYQNGYNAGYSDGETAGYGNGYSQGFADGEASVDTGAIYDEAFQAGKDSFDTQAYYDAGYQAGYDAAYSAGYDSGYDVGYKDAMDRVEKWGADTTDYPLQISDGSDNGFFSVHVGSDIPFNYRDSVSWFNSNGYNPNHTYKYVINFSNLDVGLNSDILYDYWTLYLNIGGIEYSIFPYPNSSVTVFIPGDRMATSYSFDWVLYNCANFVADDSNLAYLYVDYDFAIYDMGPSGDTQNHIANQTDQLTNGYDDSKGNEVNSELSTGLNEYQTAEDSLWATATTGLKDFTFFDFESVPAMITGMSFITSIMGSWFSHAGGASGVGIVLSILFSVMLVAMVLGLYRLYQSKGGKK